ncbi:membrane protein insertase YidC [Sphingomonas oryzagri]
MNEQRNMITALVLSAIVLLGWALLSDKFFPTANKPATQIVNGKTVALPQPTPVPNGPAQVQNRDKVLASTPRVKIMTPKLAGSIDLHGAEIDDLVLTTQRETIDKNSPPVRLFSPQGTQDAYFASFGWSGQNVKLPDANTVWTAAGDVLAPGKPVTLTWNNEQGQAFAIKLTVDENYLFTVQQSVTNGTGTPLALRPYSIVSRSGQSKDPSSWQVHVGPIGVMGGIAQYKTNWKDLDAAGAAGQKFQSTGGWLGFSDKYWLAAVIPDPKAQVDAAFVGGNGLYQAEFTPNVRPVGPAQTATQTSYLFAGGKDASLLDTYDDKYGFDKLDHAIDWGWFRVIEKPIFYLLDWLFKQVGNFGVAILLLTVIVRLIMFPIAHKQFKSGQQMKVVQPKMKALQERHKEDKTRLQEEMMKLYREEKINPVAGCLPVLLQIPIFFSLYKVLTLTLEMRHQPFILWIKDLSAPDPLTPVNLFGYLPFQPTGFLHLSVLAILLGVTMWLQFKLNPQMNMDPAQKQIFSLMPWFMMFIMSPFAAGLQVYYILSNLITVGQMQWLNSRMPAPKT